MPLPIGQLSNNVIYTGNNLPNVDNAGNVGINVAPELDAAGKANAIYKASVVAAEIDVLFTKAAASSVGSLDGAALEKAIADAKLGKSTKKELQAMIGKLVEEARSSMDKLSLRGGNEIVNAVKKAKSFANSQLSKMVESGEIAAKACKALGIDKLDDSIRYAKQLNAQGKVYGKDKWVDVVRGTTNVDAQVRSELTGIRQLIANTGTAVEFNKPTMEFLVASSQQLMSSFYARITA